MAYSTGADASGVWKPSSPHLQTTLDFFGGKGLTTTYSGVF